MTEWFQRRGIFFSGEISDLCWLNFFNNHYNEDTKMEQIKTLCDRDQFLGKFSLDSSKKVVFNGDFNLFFTQI